MLLENPIGPFDTATAEAFNSRGFARISERLEAKGQTMKAPRHARYEKTLLRASSETGNPTITAPIDSLDGMIAAGAAGEAGA